MTRMQRKKQLRTNIQVTVSVFMYIYIILVFWAKLLS